MSKPTKPTKPTEPTYLTPETFAYAAGVTARTVRRWCDEGHLEYVRATPRSPLRIPHWAASDLLRRLGRELPDRVSP